MIDDGAPKPKPPPLVCTFSGNPDEPCYGDIYQRDEILDDGSVQVTIFVACEGHREMLTSGQYIPKEAPL